MRDQKWVFAVCRDCGTWYQVDVKRVPTPRCSAPGCERKLEVKAWVNF